MHLLGTIVRTTGARRVLEIGGGLGYSALWLADAVGLGGQVETIDRFAEHTGIWPCRAMWFPSTSNLRLSQKV
jgi:predicted O-methyltransferase YrrM